MSYYQGSYIQTAEPLRRLNVAQAAVYTGISASTLNKLRVFGGGAVYSKIGRRVVYEIHALDAWLSTKRRTSTSDLGAGK